ncbi:MMPL family transporter [Pseudalkalibacillus sp. Hm43]|uniref:MMPL family transporter n=1 Tax=Pseudalkalibacillus sp. Hm43 TaxID=3450742 RepID=UPI003F4395D9
MKHIIKARWLIIGVWIASIVALLMTAPNMETLVRDKGQIQVPDGYTSTKADEILDEASGEDENGSRIALVFHNPEGLTTDDISEAEQALQSLEQDKDQLGITEITTHFETPELKDQLVSDDGNTILAGVDVHFKDRTAAETRDALYEALDSVEVDYYYTTSWMIDEDLISSSQEGLKKTEGITVVFILVVLILVFRSVVAPLIPLLTVGLTYLVSQSIVGFLVDRLDFPLSNFTQIFLVAILFGIGTDYCILLLSRFKEELSHHEHVDAAIIATYRNAGRTVIFSALAVMIGFSAIGFSTFKLYQSAAAVAVGVGVLMIALLTIVPFFLKVLGPKLFWPSKGSLEHKQSRLWGWAGRFTFARPFMALLIAGLITLPFLVTYDGKLSFNSLNEIGDEYDSVKAFNVISDSFGPGESLPTKVVLRDDDRMDSKEVLPIIEEITRSIKEIEGIETVRSATQPQGDQVEEFFVAKQAEQLNDGLGEGKDGLNQIEDGLKEASSELKKSEPELKDATSGINELLSGTQELKSGVNDLSASLTKIENGIRSGSAGASELKSGIDQAQAGIKELIQNQNSLLGGYEETAKGVSDLYDQYAGITENLRTLSSTLSSLQSDLKELGEKHGDDLKNDETYQRILKVTEGSIASTNQLVAGTEALNKNLHDVAEGLQIANSNFNKIIAAQENVTTGLNEVSKGLLALESGLNDAANGQNQVIQNVPALSNGLGSLASGQQQLLDGFGSMDQQMSDLTDGLDQSVDGLNDISNGLYDAQNYLTSLSNTGNRSTTGWYIPDEAYDSDDFQSALDAYMSENRQVTTLDVIFAENPYSTDSMDKINEIESAIERSTAGTQLEGLDYGIGGVTSINNDLEGISNSDYSRTVLFMLIGISIILIILLRSIIMPLYLVASLILTYFTSMGMTEAIFVNLLGYPGINWTVPFFGFVILVALGVDYSIFLMDRFNEYKEISVREAMILSMKNMGTVILSAAVILGGTFAAMYPSGVLSLLQIATVVLTGLFLYALVLLPLFVPVMVKWFGEANWLPFKRNS